MEAYTRIVSELKLDGLKRRKYKKSDQNNKKFFIKQIV
jgi:hypothetical protein